MSLQSITLLRNKPLLVATLSTDQSLTAVTTVDLQFDKIIADSTDSFNPANYTYTIPEDGIYEVLVTANAPQQDSNSLLGLYVRKNNTTDISVGFNYGANSGNLTTNLVDAVELKAGDTIKIRVYTDTNETLEADFTRLIVKQLAGIFVD